jgi:hypothetical protein
MEEFPSVVPVKPVRTKVDPLFFVILETLAILVWFRMDTTAHLRRRQDNEALNPRYQILVMLVSFVSPEF